MKKKIVTRIMAMMMVAGAMFGTVNMTSFAAETTTAQTVQSQATVKQTLNTDVVAKVFDATYYAEKNPDVVAVIGNAPAVLLQHYIDFGIYEGRDASATFNATIYAAANTDLATAFGENIEALIEHYVDFGQAEGRVASNDALKANGKNIASVAAPVSSSGTGSSSSVSNNSGSKESNNYSTFTDTNSYFNVLTGEITDTPVFGCIRFDEYYKYDGTDTIVTEWDFDKGTAASTVKIGETFRLYGEPDTVAHQYVGGVNDAHMERLFTVNGSKIEVDHESNITAEQNDAINATIEEYKAEHGDGPQGEWD